MRFISTLLALILSLGAIAGGKITGKITDEKTGDPLIGATVSIKNTSQGTVTDVDGNFLLSAEAGTYIIVVNYIGFQAKEIDGVTVTENGVADLNITITESKSTQLEEVVVRSTLKKENISAMILYQKNSNTISQGISAEAIKRSPDRNTGEALKRVSSASIQEGKYLVVRGLADRYNQATLNGTLLSSTEPDRKTFSFDLFPAGMIDNIVVNKAATPDLPGEFAGGLIQINTKDMPDQNFLSVQLGAGVNSQAMGNDFYTYKGGKYDFLGIDDGTRALPSGLSDRAQFAKLTKDQKYAAAKEFNNDWSYEKMATPFNKNMQVSGGVNSKVFGKNLGAIFAINYNQQNRRVEQTRSFFNQAGAVQKTLDFKENSYTQEVLAGALANITLELNTNNRISLKTLYNINGQDNTLLREGRNNEYGADVKAYQLGFKSTQYVTSQLGGSHYFKGPKLKFEWAGSYVRLAQDQPNLRRMEYRKSDGDSVYRAVIQGFLPSLSSASRFYSSLHDNVYLASGDLSHQFRLFGQQQTAKAGYMAQSKDRTFNSRPLGMVGGSPELMTLPNNEIFAPQNIGATGFNIGELSDKDYDYDAGSLLNAGYAMLDNQFGEKFRFVWGLRYESFNQTLNGFRSNKPVELNTVVGDVLPSMNLTYKYSKKVNLRFCASQTVVRPEFRELSPFTFYDFELLAAVQGNPDLKRTRITNLDLRYELYPGVGEMLTAGVFYKKFENPIEQFYNESGVNTFSYSYGNAKDAVSYGAEIEVRKRLAGSELLNKFTVFANGTYIFNEVRFDIKGVNGEIVDANRPMQGQSPYVVNGGMQFDADKTGTSATVLYNVVGRRIFLVGNDVNPSIWEAPRPLLDFQVAQKVLHKNAEIKFTVSDIINKQANFYQDKNDNGKYDTDDFLRISRRPGTNFNLSFVYNLK